MSKYRWPRASRAKPESAAGAFELVVDRQHLDRVVLEGIAKAEVSLAIATADFKAMLLPEQAAERAGSGTRRRSRDRYSILKCFRDLTARNVEIRLLHGGVPSRPVLRELRREVPHGLAIRRCPRLHAKIVIVDCEHLYLGSANLTGAGLGAKTDSRRNFELGIWTESSSTIESVLDWFNRIWEGVHCGECGRKEVCPVPLEQPGSGD